MAASPTARASRTPAHPPNMTRDSEPLRSWKRTYQPYRRTVMFINRKDGTAVVRSWPRYKIKVTSELEQAQRDDFARGAHLSNLQWACSQEQARALTPHSGFVPRDVLTVAYYGKFIHNLGENEHSEELPLLFREPPSHLYEGAPRVITPTARVRKAGTIAAVAGSFVNVIPDTKDWDNNNFWSSTTNPGRLTFRSQGLYVIHLQMHGPAVTSAEMFAQIRDKNGNQIAGNHDSGNSNFQPSIDCFRLIYANAGDWFDARLAALPNGAAYTLDAFEAVAITPETVI